MFLKKDRFRGTLNFSSINSMEGYESSRRDDLISIGYMLIFLIKEELPWSKIKYGTNASEIYINIIMNSKRLIVLKLIHLKYKTNTKK